MSNKSIDKLADQSEIDRLKAVNAELLEACKDALAQLRHIQLELENDPSAMPWPEADKLDLAIARAEGR